MSCRRGLVVLLGLLLPCLPCAADEGMWLINHPPKKLLQERYQFEPSAGWLEHVQKSAVNFGASASLVSPDGLLITNHHVGSGHLEKLSTPERNLLEKGFYAATREQELKCPDAEARILWSIEDVTERINAAVPAGASSADANAARRKAILTVEKESEEQTKLDSRVVTLYEGARFHLYRYRKYTDIRLVFAPEESIAFFGGDNDNFEYPRYDLDICLFRIYENGKPLRPEHYLKIASAGAAENELALVIGHPGHTRRLFTADRIKFMRDVETPATLASLWRQDVQLSNFSSRSDEFARIARGNLFGVENGRKRYTGQLAALQDPAFLSHKLQAEAKLREFVNSDPDRKARWGDAWDKIRDAYASRRDDHLRAEALQGLYRYIELPRIAFNLVRLAQEKPKANGERLREFGDASLDSLYRKLFSPAPIYDALQTEMLANQLSAAAITYGIDYPLIQKLLAGKSPRQRAFDLVSGTKLKELGVRHQLADGGQAAIQASDDPLIIFAIDLEAADRALRERFEDRVESVEQQAYAKIAAAQFALYGEDVYPDATASLRLAFGAVKGYTEQGVFVPPFTKTAGLYERWELRHHQPPFNLPQRWVESRQALNPNTPFNFALTADITGGNSGSPVVNRQGEFVGIIFDSNIQGLADDLLYDETTARAVAVDVRIVLESLRKVYGASRLADEMEGK